MALTEAVPEIIVLDLSLGVSDGIDVIRSLAASRFGGAILLISGRDTDTIGEVNKIGAHHGLTMLPFLQKPFLLEQFTERLGLLASIRQYLRCRDIVDLAHRFGMIVVAEGLESASDIRALTEMNCDMARGRVFAAPMERRKFRKWSIASTAAT